MRQQDSKHTAFSCILIAKDEQALHNQAEVEVVFACVYWEDTYLHSG